MAVNRDALLAVAQRAADAGAAVVSARFGRVHARGEAKGAGDWVTAIDRESETAIVHVLRTETPEIPVLAEEGGGSRGRRYWTVDPLDGTTNFMLGLPIVAVSVALVVEGRPAVGVVSGPLLDLSFSAVRGGGAWSNGHRLHVSDRPVERAVVATGFPFRHKELLPRHLSAFTKVFEAAEDVRRAGAAALDLAWTATGVFDGFFELRLGEWDVAAGGLLVEEAGGVVTDWAGDPNYLSGSILAGTAATHRLLLESAGPAP
jgi:myo-inositol-1(or 4)-monophosphatase